MLLKKPTGFTVTKPFHVLSKSTSLKIEVNSPKRDEVVLKGVGAQEFIDKFFAERRFIIACGVS